MERPEAAEEVELPVAAKAAKAKEVAIAKATFASVYQQTVWRFEVPDGEVVSGYE